MVAAGHEDFCAKRREYEKYLAAGFFLGMTLSRVAIKEAVFATGWPPDMVQAHS
jgi:hypothetical protein